MKDPIIFLEHILENIELVKKLSKNLSRQTLSQNKERQYAIVRAIEVIGEAMRNLPEFFSKKYPDVAWKEIIGTRDKLIHHYFGVDLDIIYKIINDDMPVLEKQIKEILKIETTNI